MNKITSTLLILLAMTSSPIAMQGAGSSAMDVEQPAYVEPSDEEKNRLIDELQQLLGNGVQLDRQKIVNEGMLYLREKFGTKTEPEKNDILLKIGEMRWLKNLYLFNNQLSQLPDSIGKLTQLQELDLSDNQLSQLPDWIGKLTQLQELDLSDNQLSQLPDWIGNLTQLQKLDLSDNQLSQLPDSIGKLTQLQELDLSDNQLSQLPDWIGKLTQLRWLDLSDNQLSQLPDWIGKLTQLRELTLFENRLSQLPDSIGNLTQLRGLTLFENRLSQLPDWIGKLTQLRELSLFDNQLTSVPATLGNIQTLVFLSMGNLPNLLPTGPSPDQWGRQEILRHFGDRVRGLDTPKTIQVMPPTTTEAEVYAALDQQPIRINRQVFADNRLSDITVDHVFDIDEILEKLALILTSLNFTDPTKPAYMEYETLANDYASDARNAQPLSNVDKVWQFIVPRLTGYLRTLYGVPLAQGDVSGWQMYPDKIAQTRVALTYIFDHIEKLTDPDTKMALFYQLVNGLFHCPTGQSEAINTVAFALAQGQLVASDFASAVKNILAIKKNDWFSIAILARAAENTQNVHLISFYRDQLKNKLGLLSVLDYTERMGTFGTDPFARNPANVLKVYYDLVTPDMLVNWVMDKIQTEDDLRYVRAKELLEASKPKVQLSEQQLRRIQGSGQRFIQPLEDKPIDSKFWGHFVIQEGLVKPEAIMGEETIAGRQVPVHLADKKLPDGWWQPWFTGNPLLSDQVNFSQGGWVELLRFIKAKIRPAQQFRPLNAGLLAQYLYSQEMIDQHNENWWKDYFTADPTLDENARITREGVKKALIHMGFIIEDRPVSDAVGGK